MQNIQNTFTYKYLVFLKDNIISLYNTASNVGVFNHTIKFKSEENLNKYISIWEKYDTDEIRLFLITNDNANDYVFVTLKAVIRGLLRDFIQFVNEAILNIGKGNLTVAYTLLRKPLKENLSIFEWIVADLPSFLQNTLLKKQKLIVHLIFKRIETRYYLEYHKL